MCVCLDRCVLCRKTECVKSDGEKDVIALHSSLTGNDLKAGIRLDMSNVHTCAAGIGELYHGEELRLFGKVYCLENLFVFPSFLPF